MKRPAAGRGPAERSDSDPPAPALGNRATEKLIRREPAAAPFTFDPTDPSKRKPTNLNLDPAAVQARLDEQLRPVRSWLDTNIKARSGLSVHEVVKKVWVECPDASAIGVAQVRECVQQWGRLNGFVFAPFPILGGPGLEAIMSVSVVAPTVSTKNDLASLKTEAEVPVGPSVKIGTSVSATPKKTDKEGTTDAATKVKLEVAIDVMPGAVERFQEALKVKTPLGKGKLSFSAEIIGEIEGKANEAASNHQAAGTIKGEVGAELKFQVLQLPIFLKSELKASAGLSSKEGLGTELEVTPLKLVVIF